MSASAAIRNLPPLDVKAMLDRDEIILIDVREPAEYAAERIHGALNYPLSTFDALAMPTDAVERVVLQCGTGKRSAMALERCRARGVDADAHLAGGIEAWRNAGLPTIRIDAATGKVIDPS